MAGLDTVMSGLPGEAMSFLLWNSGSQAEFWTGASVVVRGLRKDPGKPDAQHSGLWCFLCQRPTSAHTSEG